MYKLVHVSNPVNEKNLIVGTFQGLGYTVNVEQIDNSYIIEANKNNENALKLILCPVQTSGVFVLDNCIDSNKILTDHVGQIGAVWTRKNNFWGNLQIVNNKVCGDFNEANSRASGLPASSEYSVKCKIHIVTEEAADFAGPCGRLHATDSIFYLASAEPAMNRWRLLRMQLGNFVTLGVWNTKPVTGDVVELEIKNSAKKLLVNGIERISSNDNVITDPGYVGLYCNFSSPTQGVHLYDLEAKNL